MPWRINKIKLILFPIMRLVDDAHGIGFDGDTTLTLDIHIIEKLRRHITLVNRMREL